MMNELGGKNPEVEAIIQNGWLHARCIDGDGLLKWHIILGRTNTLVPPKKRVEQGIIEIRQADGSYFVRDTSGANRISCVREVPGSNTSPGVDTNFLENAIDHGHARGGKVRISVKEKNSWIWVLLGSEEGQPTAVIRMIPTILVPEKSVVGAFSLGLVEFIRDKASLTDDGEFLQARYVTGQEAEQDLNQKKLAKGALPPELAAERWINLLRNDDGQELRGLGFFRGKVVLLSFWATWCTPCVKHLPELETLYRKYEPNGLVIIAIHPSANVEEIDEFIEKHEYSLPVIVDTGETYRRYGIRGIPQYILIGKDGKLASSGLHSRIPDQTELESLLRA